MKDKLYQTLILMPFLWAFTGLLFFRNGDKLMIIAIVISIVATLLHCGVSSIKKNITDKGLWLLLVITGYVIFSYFYHGASSREMRALVGATLLLFTFPRELITTRILKWLTVLGSIVILSSSYYFSVYLRLSRGAWPINAIPHGTLGSVIAVLALIFLLNAEHQRDRILLSASLIMTITAIVINQSRGIWLSLLVAIIIILLFKLKIKHINWKQLLITVMLIFIGLYFSQAKIQQRIDGTKLEIIQMQSGDFNTNIGARLELWRVALQIIPEKPILGIGNENREILLNLAEKGELLKSVAQLSHYHNQYLDRLVKAGVIGFILLLALFIYPVVSTATGVNRQIAIAVIIVYAVAGLTDVPLNHGAPLFMYLLLMFTLKKNDEASD